VREGQRYAERFDHELELMTHAILTTGSGPA
jgi:hypothetical protein